MVREDFAAQALEHMGDQDGETIWIEPIWKMLWSNKGILPVLHRLFPENPHVLPAWFEGEQPGSGPSTSSPRASGSARATGC